MNADNIPKKNVNKIPAATDDNSVLNPSEPISSNANKLSITGPLNQLGQFFTMIRLFLPASVNYCSCKRTRSLQEYSCQISAH